MGNVSTVKLTFVPDLASINVITKKIRSQINISLAKLPPLNFKVNVKGIKAQLKNTTFTPKIDTADITNKVQKSLDRVRLNTRIVNPRVNMPRAGGGGTSNVPTNIPTPIPQATGLDALVSTGLGTLSTGLGVGIAKSIATVGSEFRSYMNQLETGLGSIDAAKAKFKELSKLAEELPLDMGEVAASFNKLKNRGVAPLNSEITKMTDLSFTMGKSLDQYVEAVLDGMTGEFERLKEFGIKASKSGDKVTFSFKGVETQMKMSETAIYDYLIGLGALEGVAGGSAKEMNSLRGVLSNINDTIRGLQWDLFNGGIESIMVTGMKVIGEMLSSIRTFVNEFPRLGEAIAILSIVTPVITGLGLAFVGLKMLIIPVVAAIVGSLLPLIAIVSGLTLVIWDLWKGFTTGESYILGAIDSLLEFLGINVTVKEIINATKDIIVNSFNFIKEVATAIFLEAYNNIKTALKFIVDTIKGSIEFIVNLFTVYLPNAGLGVEILGAGIKYGFFAILETATSFVADFYGIIAKGIGKVADLMEKVPFLSDTASSLKGVYESAQTSINELAEAFANKKLNAKATIDTNFATIKGLDKFEFGGEATLKKSQRFIIPGLGEKEDDVKKSIDNGASKTTKALGDGFKGTIQALKGGLDKMYDYRSDEAKLRAYQATREEKYNMAMGGNSYVNNTTKNSVYNNNTTNNNLGISLKKISGNSKLDDILKIGGLT